MVTSFPGSRWAGAHTLGEPAAAATRSLWLSHFFQGLTQEPTLPLELPEKPEPGVQTPLAVHGTRPVGHSPLSPAPSASQREHQALQDLLDLAGEGLSASPWPCSGGPAGSGGATGETLAVGASPPWDQGRDSCSDPMLPGLSPCDRENVVSLGAFIFPQR